MTSGTAGHPAVSIVILNYNSQAHLADNLASLFALTYPPEQIEILLVDNASHDNSVAWVADHYPTVRHVANGANLGFAAGNNAGVMAASHNWVVILNPDIRVTPDWLTELIRPTQESAEIVCVASQMLSWDGQQIDFADAAINFMGWGCQPNYGHRRPGWFNTNKPLLFASGGAMLVRRDIFLAAGGFDPDFFAYFEDVDLGWRLWLLGQRVHLAARAVVYHRHHGSWGDVPNPRRWLLSERNTLLTVLKNYGTDSLTQVLPAVLLLMAQRAYLDIWPDPAIFGDEWAMPVGSVFGPRYYLGQLAELVQHGRFQELTYRLGEEVRRRWQKRRQESFTPEIPTFQPVADGRFLVSPLPLSRLLAAADVQRLLPDIWARRAELQARRRRRDEEIFPLFGWALTSNFGDGRFIYSMNQVIQKFDLKNLFHPTRTPQPLPADTHPLSQQISRHLLRLMAQIFAQSGVPAAAFRLDGPPLAESYAIPLDCVARLHEINRIIWALPNAPLPQLLTWLAIELETRPQTQASWG